MTSGTLFIRAWRIVAILGFLVSLFSSYISYPEEVAVRFDDTNRAIQYINRETLFYVSIAIFLISLMSLRALGRMFPRVPSDSLPIPNQAEWAAHRPQLNTVFINWFYALTAAITTILALGLFVLSLLNQSARTVRFIDYGGLLPVCTAIIIIVLAALPIRLFMKPSADE
ncbi:hypothetical protein [Spirosoma rhododendri]|uniref:DUF1648 domain-containing protein n=1 Tax=Spirosoma rhododendri TaxID=2728024 RepID=A0A7L5DNE2_9BACT|nr:hypothetical protein [Spirosoma rhododendri]QJD79001.1 hypothetical protein HH216_11610 [Spirosoma rhododendri]